MIHREFDFYWKCFLWIVNLILNLFTFIYFVHSDLPYSLSTWKTLIHSLKPITSPISSLKLSLIPSFKIYWVAFTHLYFIYFYLTCWIEFTSPVSCKCEFSYFSPSYSYLYVPSIVLEYSRFSRKSCWTSEWINKVYFMYPQYLIQSLVFKKYWIKIDSPQYHKAVGQSGINENQKVVTANVPWSHDPSNFGILHRIRSVICLLSLPFSWPMSFDAGI